VMIVLEQIFINTHDLSWQLLCHQLSQEPEEQPKMRAVLIRNEKGPVQNLYIGDAPNPFPKVGEVLVKVSTRERKYSYNQ